MSREPLRVLHLTDLHLVSDPGGTVAGVDPLAALESLLPRMRDESWRPDLVVVTGDLSEDGSTASYRRLHDLLAPLGIPVLAVPGNHDERAGLEAHFPVGPAGHGRRVVREPWQVIVLDSQVPGMSHGHLSAAELARLEATLRERPECHALVGLHHGPHPTCPMPYCALENREEFLAVLRRHPMVRAVISGHTHCAVDEVREGVRMIVSPSTFLQVGHPTGPARPDASFWDVHTGDAARRGFRRLELHPDGTIVTGIVWDRPGGSAAA